MKKEPQSLQCRDVSFLDRLEQHLARFAIPGLIRYVVALNALVFLLTALNPGFSDMLQLNRSAILQGQAWRCITWIFIPTSDSFLWIFFYLWSTWWIGDCLEETWGTFRLNVYYLVGILGGIAAAFAFGFSGGNYFLNLTLLFAIATLAPNMQILIWGILPVPLKWLAWIGLIYPLMFLVLGSLAVKLSVILGLISYPLFFATHYLGGYWKSERPKKREKITKLHVPEGDPLHRCETCGATEFTEPDAEFRVTTDGREYCAEHLPDSLSKAG